jgi:phosphoribosylanthranilate isomerase
MRTRVKICGITNLDDAEAAVECGADAMGFVFWTESPRSIAPDEALRIVSEVPPFLTTVGVFVNEPPEVINQVVRRVGLGCVQLHGEEPPEGCEGINAKVIKAVRVSGEKDIEGLDRYDVSAFMLDTFREGVQGGTGETFDWDIAIKAKRFGPLILSGGLTPENVAGAITHVRPYGVDVSSGVEREPGKKDPEKIRNFIDAVRGLERVRGI